MMKRMILVSAVALALGCGGDNNEENNGTNNGGGGLEAGNYTVTVLDVDDQCFDGAMDTIVLPDGMPRDLPAPVGIPGSADLPGTIDIQFTAPFQSVTGVAVEASGNNGITTSGTGFTQEDVDISSAGDGSCLADMNVTFTLTASADGKLTGSGSLSITAAEGASCPAFQAGPPCSVISNLEATKN